jgi:hypothetical protein
LRFWTSLNGSTGFTKTFWFGAGVSDRTIEYTPSPTLAAFHQSNAFVRGVRGPIGSGKSVGMCWEIYSRAMEQLPGPDGVRRSRCVVIRNTYGELESTTLKTWLDWFPAEIVGRVNYQAPIEQHCTFVHDDGSTVKLEMLFLACDRPDHVKKLLSLECTFGWVNEARELPKAIIDALTGRVGRYPSARDGGATWYGVIMDTNPPDTDHWWYRLAEEECPAEWEFFSQPAGDSDEAENLDFLTQTQESIQFPVGHTQRRAAGKTYYQRLRSGKSDEWVKVYVKGDYGYVLDGKPVYPEFSHNIHVGEFELNQRLPLFGGFDFGLTPAGLVAQRTPNGRVLIDRELVTDNMGIKRFGEMWRTDIMERHYPGWTWERIAGDPAGDARNSEEHTCFEILASEHIQAVPAQTNDFVKRREAFALPMTRLIDGKAGLIVHKRCTKLIKALAGGYNYRRIATGNEKFVDKPDKNMHSHVAEAGQYLLLGMGEYREVMRRPGTRAMPKFAGRNKSVLR